MDALDPIVFDGITFPTGPKELRETIGPSKGKVDMMSHLGRIKFLLDHVPDTVWPSSAVLKDLYKGRRAAIVGGGPSLLPTMDSLRRQHNAGDIIVAPNKSHDWLIKGERLGKRWKRKPLIPTFGVMTDPDLHVATYMTPHPKVSYLLGAILDYRTWLPFLKAQAQCYIWIPAMGDNGEDIDILRQVYEGERELHCILGASTVGLRTIGLLAAMGFETVDLYGFDSCYAPGSRTLYAYDKPFITKDKTNPVAVSQTTGHQFRCWSNHHMAKQAMEFEKFAKRLQFLVIDGKMQSVRIRVHGDGLIPWMVWKDGGDGKLFEHADPKVMEAKYGDAKYFDYHEGRAYTAPFMDA